jgi:Bax protein
MARLALSILGPGVFLAGLILAVVLQWSAATWSGLSSLAVSRPGYGPALVLAEQSRWVRSAEQLAAVFDTERFDLAAVRSGAPVPRLYLTTLPQDIAAITALDLRKDVFIRVALPLILRVDERIRDERLRLRDIMRRRTDDAPISYAERQWLDDLGRRYGVADGDLDELLLRVDEIPPSLALAQAATESGWGTSRIARAGNALFGQKAWGEDGVKPLEASDGQSFRYAAFDQLVDCIGAYARNLNTHPAYAGFRAARAAMRKNQDALDGASLAATLGSYSTRGADYIGDLQMLIYENWLWAYDRAHLDMEQPAQLLVPAI